MANHLPNVIHLSLALFPVNILSVYCLQPIVKKGLKISCCPVNTLKRFSNSAA